MSAPKVTVTISGRAFIDTVTSERSERSGIERVNVEYAEPYKVRMSCGHIVERMMRPSTVRVAWSETVVLEAPGMPCPECSK